MNLNVTCAIQVMSDTHADMFSTALMNIDTQLLGNISVKVTIFTNKIFVIFTKGDDYSNIWDSKVMSVLYVLGFKCCMCLKLNKVY